MNPYLPVASSKLNASHTRKHRKECAELFYLSCLELSQSYWIQGKQAQAILQLNKAFMADISDFNGFQPYMALRWLLENRRESEFLGNPTRHFQHLATRMSGLRKDLRIFRAWACFYISKCILPSKEFPEDLDQIRKESLVFPDINEVYLKLNVTGLLNECDFFLEALNASYENKRHAGSNPAPSNIFF